MTKKINYDIQGLRAIAVIAVVVFHINPHILPGGFLGVDIFFVISGYLIIGHIWDSLDNNSFNLLSFYEKRVKRLFPALFVMILVSIIIGYFLLLPNETIDFHKSVISSLFYFSNFYFYTVSDYFNTSIHYSPLLHTWSLSVEEQFYLFFPLFLIFIHKIFKNIKKILIILFVLFLILSILLVIYNESFAFYSSPSRFFQFLAGGLLSVFKIKNEFSKKRNEIFSIIGIGILVICLFKYSNDTTFPGINALIPSFATILIIYSSQKSKYISLLLSNKISQFLGNSSYSIYLWHWPLIVYYKLYFSSSSLSKYEQVILLVISIILGYLSWRFIENKTRYSKFKYNLIFTSLSISILTTILLTFTFDGLKYRYNENQLALSSYLKYDTSDYRGGKCFLTSKYNDISFFDDDLCIKHNKNKKNVLLIGDSHAAMFYKTFSDNLDDKYTLTQITASGCRPLLNANGAKRCTDLMKYTYEDILKNYKFDIVVISGRWKKSEFNQIAETLKYLEKNTNKILLVGDGVSVDINLPKILIKHANHGSSFLNKNEFNNFNETFQNQSDIKQIIREKFTKVKFISTFDPFCNKDGCEMTINKKIPVIFDTNHLTFEALDIIYKQQISKNFN